MHEQRILFGAFALDPARGALFRDGAPVQIGHRAVALLHALARANGQVLTKAELFDAAWPGAVVEESNLSVQIAALRKLLGRSPDEREAIATVERVGYRFSLPVEIGSIEAGAPPDAKPSIAVLPLANLSGDPSQEYFVDGVTEDILTALSRFRWFRVVGRGSSFAFKDGRASTQDVAAKLGVRYVLEGSVRKSAGRVRVTLQLVEASGASQLWGETYDFAEGELFAVQDSVARQVAGAIEPELLKVASSSVATERAGAAPSLQDMVYRGIWLFHRVTRESHLEARELFRKACALDPDQGQAQHWLARVNAGLVAYGWNESVEGDLREGVEAAARSIRADERNPYAHYALAITSAYAGLFEQSQRAAQRAIELAPGFALGHLVSGLAQLYGGDAKGAVGPLSRGLQLNAFDPQNFVWYTALAYAHLFAGDPVQALDCARRAQEIRADWTPALEAALCALNAQGDDTGARECGRRVAAMRRDGADPLRPAWENNPDWREARARWLQDQQPTKSL